MPKKEKESRQLKADHLFLNLDSYDQIIAEMTDGGVDRSVECTGHIDAMISAFECVHDVCFCHQNFLSYMFYYNINLDETCNLFSGLGSGCSCWSTP